MDTGPAENGHRGTGLTSDTRQPTAPSDTRQPTAPSDTQWPPAPSDTDDGAALDLLPAGRWSPRRRARVIRLAEYVVLGALLVVVALSVDWANVGSKVFNVQVALSMLPKIPSALGNTLLYTVSSFAVGLSLGLLLALMKLSSVLPYRWIATAYTEFFRGIPALLVVLAFGFTIPIVFGVRFSSMTVQIALALGMVSAAYVSETIRAGIQAVPRGQVEAARSLGMSHARTLITVVIPQAFRIVLPPMTNELILLTKDTSLVYLIGVSAAQYELTKLGKNMLNQASGGMTALFVIGLCYLCITIPLGIVARRLEHRTTVGGRS